MSKLYVRLRKFDPKAGNVIKRYDYLVPQGMPGAGQFLTFDKPMVWVVLPSELAAKLKQCRQIETSPLSPPVFDVCTEKEARELDEQSRMDRERAQAIREPTVDTAMNMTDVAAPNNRKLDRETKRSKEIIDGAAPEDDDPSTGQLQVETARFGSDEDEDEDGRGDLTADDLKPPRPVTSDQAAARAKALEGFDTIISTPQKPEKVDEPKTVAEPVKTGKTRGKRGPRK